MVAVEVPAKHSNLEQVSGQAPVVQTRGRPGSVNLVEHIDFCGGENRARGGVGLVPCRHCEEKDSPAHHRNESKELRQPIRGFKPRLLSPAPRLHDLVECLNFPAQSIPAEFLDGGSEVSDLDLSRFCAAPLITYCAAKGMNHEHRQDG